MDIAQLLAKCSYFQGLSPENRSALARLFRPRELARRGLLFREGQAADSVYLLGSGCVQLAKAAPDGREVAIRTVQPGELFGEAILFERTAYPVSAMALRRCTVWRLLKQDFRQLLRHESFTLELLALMSRRLRYLADRIVYLTSCDVEERFFGFLRDQYGENDSYVVPLSKKDVAVAIGTTPESLSRLLLRLKKEKKALWTGRSLMLRPGLWKTLRAD